MSPLPLPTPPVHAAFEKQRERISGGEALFPGQWTSGRFALDDELLGHDEQLAADAMSASGKPVPDSLPLSGREPAAAWILSSVEPRWGHAIDANWDGEPITFMEPRTVNPRFSDWTPMQQYPSISRGHPIPFGSTQPILGE